MLCSQIFNFVSETEIVMSPSAMDPQWDIVRPNSAAEALLSEYARMLGARIRRSRRPDRATPSGPSERPHAAS